MTSFDRLSAEELLRVVEQAGSLRKAAELLGAPWTTFRRRVKAAKRQIASGRAAPRPLYPDPLPSADIDDETWLDLVKQRYRLRRAHFLARQWRKVSVPCAGPYALLVLGDPHVDDDGCDWDQIETLEQLQKRNLGRVWAVNIGDTTNNWGGRLAHLWSEQSTSSSDARRAARVFMQKFVWGVWLHGNHDTWRGPVGAEWFEAHKPEFCVMEDWQAKLVFESPCGTQVRAWFAHDFKGHSFFNPMHGPLRASKMDDHADLYVAGHKHIAGVMQTENTADDNCPVLLRVRGFKYNSTFDTRHQFPEYQHGAAALVVINPQKQGYGRVTAFLDPFAGEAYLRALLA